MSLQSQQLYLAIGIPSFVALIGILVNSALYIALANTLNARMTALENRMTSLEATITTRFDLLMGKLAELDTRH
jgi:hypothetical protein